MARIGISITKSTSFRNSTQEFSNVYYYDGLAGTPSEAEATALIDELVTKERPLHSTAVTFVRGRCWSQVGTPAQNNMLAQKNLTGTGTKVPETSFDKERALLFRLRAGSDSRGNPVYLRKWYHADCFFSATSNTSTLLKQTTGFTQSEKDALVAAMQSIGTCGSGTTAGVLCAKSGRLPTAGETWKSHNYLEHHQLGDQWRAQ